jgi:hypothetical protein
MQRQSVISRAIRVVAVLTVILVTAAAFPSSPRPVGAQAPTPFLASPYYGPPGDGVSRRWIPGVHYGIDFVLRYAPVLAAAGGTVYQSEWSNLTCHNDGWPGCVGSPGYGLHVRVSHSNGYDTIYGHLSAAGEDGRPVRQGGWVGTSGDTGYSTGPHLHFEVRHNGVAVNPDNENGVSLWLHGEWSGADPAQSVSSWRFPTLNAHGGAVVVDDNTSNTGGFTKGKGWSGGYATCPPGSCPYWWRVTGIGHDSDMYYTHVWGDTRDYWARWQPSLSRSGLYEVSVYIPCYGGRGDRTWYALYRIHSNSYPYTFEVRVDQVDGCNTWVNNWISLGHHYFTNGGGGRVYIWDNTGESHAITGREVLVDAVKFQRVNVGTFEAEHFRQRIGRTYQGYYHNWEYRNDSNKPGFSGGWFMQARPHTPHKNVNSGYTTRSPELQYRVVFPAAGTYYVWVRAYGKNGKEDSVHAGLDGQAISSADRMSGCNWNSRNWIWCNSTMDGPRATIYVSDPGLHTFNLWMRENGFRADQILLTQNPNYTP